MLILMTATVVLYLWLVRTFHAMLMVLGAAVGGQLLSALMKAVFARPRPNIVPHLTPANFSSFPSGHSMSAAAVYLTLGLLLARFTDRTRLRIYFLVLNRIRDVPRRHQPHLPRGPLPDRCAGQLGGQVGLGDLLLATSRQQFEGGLTIS